MAKSLLDIAYDYVESTSNGCSFNELWAHVVETAELTKEVADKKVARFYTNLMLDGRFVTLGDNIWDLRSRNTFDKADRGDPEILYAETDETSTDNTSDLDEEEKDSEEDFDEDSEENEEEKEENY